MREYTYVMVKPDGVEKGLVFEICKRIKSLGLKILYFDVRKLNGEVLDEHYAHVADKPFYPEMKEFMLSGFVVPMIVYGENAVSKVRELMGPTNSANASAGTIRGDYGSRETVSRNIIHGSDSLENAIIEIKRFFNIEEDEINEAINLDDKTITK